MSAVTGEQANEDYIQVGGTKWPLPRAPEGEAGHDSDWGSLHFSPLEPFSPTTVAGDDTLVSDDRIAQQVWADMRAGIGLFEYTEAESLSGCQDSDLDTSQGVIILPTKKVVVGATFPIPGAWAATGPIYGIRINDGSNFRWCVWKTTSDTFYLQDAVSTGWLGVQLVPGAIVNAIIPFSYHYVMATSNGIYAFLLSGSTLTPDTLWVTGSIGLCEHDGKVYTYRPSDNKLYWSTQPLLPATAWTGVSAFTVPLEPGEAVRQLLEWKDAFDNRCVTIITDRRVVLYSDQDYFGTLFRTGKQGGNPRATVWSRDDNLYLTNYPYNDTIWAIDHQSVDEVSPNKNGGIQANQTFAVAQLSGDFRHLYAFCPTRTGKSNPGRVLKAIEAFGWSALNRGDLADPQDWDSAVTNAIVGGAYGQDEVLTVYASGKTVVQQSPDRGDLAYNVDDLTYENGPLWLCSAWTDCGLETAAKVAAWWRINAIRNDRTFGLPTGGVVRLVLEFDTSSPATAVTTLPLTNAAVWPHTIPLPSTGQNGQPFVRMRWKIGLTSTGVTPIIRANSLHYERAPDIYDGLQVSIDLSHDRFPQEDSRFYLKTRADLMIELDRLKQGPNVRKQFFPVVVARGTGLKTYTACDVRVSGNLDPSTGYGTLVFTLRDVSAPPSGSPSDVAIFPV